MLAEPKDIFLAEGGKMKFFFFLRLEKLDCVFRLSWNYWRGNNGLLMEQGPQGGLKGQN